MKKDAGCIRLIDAFQYVDDRFLDLVEQQKKNREKNLEEIESEDGGLETRGVKSKRFEAKGLETKWLKDKKLVRRPVWTVAAAAAAVFVLLMFPVGVAANNWFGLKDLLLRRETTSQNLLVLSDYLNAAEVQAAVKWAAFLEDYDRDGEILANLEGESFVAEGREDWSLYGVYSYEMGERLDEIAGDHGLQLHTTREYLTPGELDARIGGSLMAGVFREECFVYEDGSFGFLGVTEQNVEFSLVCAMRGSLDAALADIGRSKYEKEWQYTSVCGEDLLLAQGPWASLILADLDDRFIILYVSEGSEGGVTEETLQTLADLVDYSLFKDHEQASLQVGFDQPEYTQISLSGYQNSPEAQALAEWDFYWNNWTDQHRDELDNSVFVAEGREDWFLYGVFAYEMGEKLDEIAQRYGLNLHTEINVVSKEELEYRVGGSYLTDQCTGYWGYIYEDGSFHEEADIELDGCGIVDFQLGRAVKGTLDFVTLNIGPVEDYAQWQYVTACGEQVMLALSDHKALIFGDFEECFFSVNVLAGSGSGLDREKLQMLADQFDLVVLKNVQIPEMRGDSVSPRLDTETVMLGELKHLGTGRLFYVITDDDDVDYKMYFVETDESDWLYELSDYDLEKAYVLPDVRKDNASIGWFWQIYFSHEADITGDGRTDLILVSRYKEGEAIYYDTRIYEWDGEKYFPNYELMREYNEKYWDTEEYPVDEMLALPEGR